MYFMTKDAKEKKKGIVAKSLLLFVRLLGILR